MLRFHQIRLKNYWGRYHGGEGACCVSSGFCRPSSSRYKKSQIMGNEKLLVLWTWFDVLLSCDNCDHRKHCVLCSFLKNMFHRQSSSINNPNIIHPYHFATRYSSLLKWGASNHNDSFFQLILKTLVYISKEETERELTPRRHCQTPWSSWLWEFSSQQRYAFVGLLLEFHFVIISIR